jgi:hypothetical protein
MIKVFMFLGTASFSDHMSGISVPDRSEDQHSTVKFSFDNHHAPFTTIHCESKWLPPNPHHATDTETAIRKMQTPPADAADQLAVDVRDTMADRPISFLAAVEKTARDVVLGKVERDMVPGTVEATNGNDLAVDTASAMTARSTVPMKSNADVPKSRLSRRTIIQAQR